MLVSLQTGLNQSINKINNIEVTKPGCLETQPERNLVQIPLKTLQAFYNINTNRVPNMGPAEYLALSENQKNELRQKCESFGKISNSQNSNIDKKIVLPLSTPKSMDEFIGFVKKYDTLKDSPVICLGRSPKWFLDTSKWMKGGIEDYKFVAFSKSWYLYTYSERGRGKSLVRFPDLAPNEAEEAAYKKYLKSISADPKSIVEKAKATGKKVVITDYVDTAKGVTSFLELMSNIAESQGVLKEFANSIRFVLIDQMDQVENLHYDDELISKPEVRLPDSLKKVAPKNFMEEPHIDERYFDMPLDVFEDFLSGNSTSKCLSGYYPKELWAKVKPIHSDVPISPKLNDFRNLLKFRILDNLHARNLLKLV